MTTAQPMGFVPASVATDPGYSEEDLARADTYGLLAEWFIREPSDDLFNRLAGSPAIDEGDQSDLANAWRNLMDFIRRLIQRLVRPLPAGPDPTHSR